MKQVDAFRGLNSVTDPIDLGLEWLTTADNVHVTDVGRLQKRSGYDLGLAAAALSGAYATEDQQRAYVADGALKQLVGEPGNLSTTTIAPLRSKEPMQWTEINGQVFFNNGDDMGVIDVNRGLMPWRIDRPQAPEVSTTSGTLPAGQYLVRLAYRAADGRIGPSSDFTSADLDGTQALRITGIPASTDALGVLVFIAPANSQVYGLAAERPPAALVWNLDANTLGMELTTADLDSTPVGCDVIQAWNGRMHMAMYMPASDQTVIWRSLPLQFHLFAFAEEYTIVAGRVRTIGPADEALIVGTEREIIALDKSYARTSLAAYGVPLGRHWARDDESRLIYFWSNRGVCRAMPFENITERQVSVAPGVSAGATIVEQDGQKRFVVSSQQGGAAYNSR